MNAIAYAEKSGLDYKHTPFKKMGHDVDPDLIDEFIGIKYFFEAADSNTPVVRAEHISKLRCLNQPPHVHEDKVQQNHGKILHR